MNFTQASNLSKTGRAKRKHNHIDVLAWQVTDDDEKECVNMYCSSPITTPKHFLFTFDQANAWDDWVTV